MSVELSRPSGLRGLIYRRFYFSATRRRVDCPTSRRLRLGLAHVLRSFPPFLRSWCVHFSASWLRMPAPDRAHFITGRSRRAGPGAMSRPHSPTWRAVGGRWSLQDRPRRPTRAGGEARRRLYRWHCPPRGRYTSSVRVNLHVTRPSSLVLLPEGQGVTTPSTPGHP